MEKIKTMIIKTKNTKETAKTPSIKNGLIEMYTSDIISEIGRDGRLILRYISDVDIEIPEGHIGIIIPAERAYTLSLEVAGGQSVVSGNVENFSVRFKTNTDSIPSIFEQGEIFARILIVENKNIDIESVEYKEEEK